MIAFRPSPGFRDALSMEEFLTLSWHRRRDRAVRATREALAMADGMLGALEGLGESAMYVGPLASEARRQIAELQQLKRELVRAYRRERKADPRPRT